jgi:hypothetical protein
MSRRNGREADMAELRTTVGRLRAETAAFRDRMERAKADLEPRIERARADREAAMAELRHDLNNGQVPAQDRALVERVVSGQTSWRAVYSGEDDHWTAVEHRERFGRELSDGVEQLVREDDDFADLLHDLQRRATPAEDRDA